MQMFTNCPNPDANDNLMHMVSGEKKLEEIQQIFFNGLPSHMHIEKENFLVVS